jgi:hypothetical protein
MWQSRNGKLIHDTKISQPVAPSRLPQKDHRRHHRVDIETLYVNSYYDNPGNRISCAT